MEGNIAEALRQQGYRPTPQRLLILEAVRAASGHITPEEIHRQASAQYPHLNISTVYRTLELLKRVGLLTDTGGTGERHRWHRADEGNHHHLRCDQCGAMEELTEDFLASLRGALERDYGFQASLNHIVIPGRCRRCQGR